jgi:hypothetical protein
MRGIALRDGEVRNLPTGVAIFPGRCPREPYSTPAVVAGGCRIIHYFNHPCGDVGYVILNDGQLVPSIAIVPDTAQLEWMKRQTNPFQYKSIRTPTSMTISHVVYLEKSHGGSHWVGFNGGTLLLPDTYQELLKSEAVQTLMRDFGIGAEYFEDFRRFLEQ